MKSIKITLIIGLIMIFNFTNCTRIKSKELILPNTSGNYLSKNYFYIDDKKNLIIGAGYDLYPEEDEAIIYITKTAGENWEQVNLGKGVIYGIASTKDDIFIILNKKDNKNKQIGRILIINKKDYIITKSYEFNTPLYLVKVLNHDEIVLLSGAADRQILISYDKCKSWVKVLDINNYIDTIYFIEHIDFNNLNEFVFFSKGKLLKYNLEKQKITLIDNFGSINVKTIKYYNNAYYILIGGISPYILVLREIGNEIINLPINKEWSISEKFYIYEDTMYLLLYNRNASFWGISHTFLISKDSGKKWKEYSYSDSLKASPIAFYKNEFILINSLRNKINLLELTK